MVTREVLDTGLRLITETMPHVRSVSIGVWLTRGSRHEVEPQGGIAHFVEHMLFKGTDTRSAEDIAQEIDSIGGQLDAFTAKEYASYYIKVLDEHLGLAVDLLSDIVMRPRFDGEDIEKEKKVILEEIKMVEDTPDDLVHELFTQHFWEGHALGRPILGAKETVESFTSLILRDYFGTTYVAPNLIVSAAGNVEHARVRDLVSRAFAALPTTARPYDDTVPRVVPQVLVRTKELEQSHVCLGTNSYPQNHPDRYVGYIMNTVLGGSMSSRLFQNVREKRGLAYAVFSGLSAYRDAGNLTIYAGCANEAVAGGRRPLRRRAAGAEAGAGGGAGAAPRQGSSQGQPDAEPREHGEPDVAPGAAGDLLRAPLRARRDARRRRAGERGRRAARRVGSVRQRVAGRHRRRSAAAGRHAGETGSWLSDARRRPAAAEPETPRGDAPASEGGTERSPTNMIERYTNPEMGAIWSDRRRYETWLEVELAAADATAEAGLIPARGGRRAARHGRHVTLDIARIEEIEKVTQHDVIAFTTAVAEQVGPAARWLHFGLTSSDVLDTAQAIQMREACGAHRSGTSAC